MSEKILATVAGVDITDANIDAFIEKLPKEQQMYAAHPQFRAQVLEQVINMSLFMKYAEEIKLDESAEYKSYIEQARRDILSQMAINKTVDGISVTEEEARAYYEANKSQFGKEETVSARHILVDEKDTCDEILEEINEGKKTFEEAAKAYSTCPSSQKGGDLGEFGHGQMVKEFDQAAFEAEVGAVVGPVKTQFGYHLIKVYAKNPAIVAPFEAVANQAESGALAKKQQGAYEAVLSDLRAKYM